MSSGDKCRECGAVIPAGSPGGLCGKCLLELGLGEQPQATPHLTTGNVDAASLPQGSESAEPRPEASDSNGGKIPKISQTEKPGDRIGHYKLLERIGRGGMGMVWMAEQVRPVRRRVALKIIKLGMDSEQLIARFEAERQALALMEHPNIAKVFDAGTTETGRPYFVMELVRGIRLTDYCDQNNLSTPERLDLFAQVCHAIQHAHQKGVIHRDIKPSNILVTLHDSVPVPKVIDFGIAKAAAGQRLTDKTLFTAFEQFLGTPAYMSPEQAEMSGLDIDTRSDIYALGVLLYELLVGRTPFDSGKLLQAGIDEMRRIIREEEAVRPSACLSTLAVGELTTVANHRQCEPAKLSHLLRGDLDWVVMKCLEKDRTRRYETANGLAADLQRHLQNEPVLASPPSKLYRFQKTVRRHKLAFAAAGAVLASLLLGLGATTIMFFKEQAARRTAVEERQRLQTLNEFLISGLVREEPFGLISFKPAPGESILTWLEHAASSIGDKFRDQPLVEAKLRIAIGNAYSSLDVGRPELAIPHYERAIALRRIASGANDASTLDVMRQLVVALKSSGRVTESMAVKSEALKLISDPTHRRWFMECLADDYERDSHIGAAIKTYEELVVQTKSDPELGPMSATYLGKLATLYEKQNDLEKAEACLTNAIIVMKKKDPTRSSPQYIGLGRFLVRQKRYSDAVPVLQTALRLREANNRYSPLHALRGELGEALLRLKRFSEAERFLMAAYAGWKDGWKEREAGWEEDGWDRDGMPGKEKIRIALINLVTLYTEWGKATEAAEWKDALAAFQASHPPK